MRAAAESSLHPVSDWAFAVDVKAMIGDDCVI
jgi:hypothetical protein